MDPLTLALAQQILDAQDSDAVQPTPDRLRDTGSETVWRNLKVWL
jgi:hypothetical protein